MNSLIKRMREKEKIQRNKAVGFVLLLCLIASGFFIDAMAEDYTEELWENGPVLPHNNYLRLGLIIGSDHVGEGSWNEEQNGYYLGYKGWTFGQYENSYSKQDDYGKMNSSFIYYEAFMYRKDWIETSFSVGLVDGYPEEATTFNRSTIPWVTLNIRFGRSLGAKLWHLPMTVTAYGVEYRKEMAR